MPTADHFHINLSLVSHTNIGKTTLARTLLMQDVGEVADRADDVFKNDKKDGPIKDREKRIKEMDEVIKKDLE